MKRYFLGIDIGTFESRGILIDESFRVAADARDLNYDKYMVSGTVETQADESYTSHNTERLDVDGVVDKLLSLSSIREALERGKEAK